MEINILERLPRDLLFYKIFPLLLVQDLLTLPCLNKTWKHLMEDERLWNFLLKEIQKVYYLDLAELKDLSPKKIYLKYFDESWDPNHKSNEIEILKDGFTLRGRGVQMGAMARSKVGFISGKHYWEMIPTLVIGSGDVYIGIVNEKVTEFSIRVGFCHNSWAYYDSRGSKVHSGERKTYAEGFRQRDVIGVYLDVDNKSISFSKNGIDNKVAFNDLHGEVFYCAASCFCTGTEIQKVKKKNSKYSKVYLH